MDDTPKTGISVEQPSFPGRTATIGWALVAIAAQVALVDAAIETFRGGSPTRWWVAAPVLVFVALSVWLWRLGGAAAKRWGWPGVAQWSLGGLLAMLAVTAWLPDGQVNGVRMALQPTSTVLAAAVALAVLLAAFVLVRGLGFLPRTARLVARGIVILLAIYALAALGVAIRDHATFASLFQGGAVWQRLPRWLQGTFIGALVLLPLAILGQIVQVVDVIQRRQPVRGLIGQATALVMSLVMATSGVVPPGAGAAATASSRSSAAGDSSAGGPAPAAEGPTMSLDEWRRDTFRNQDPDKIWERYARAATEELNRPGADPSDIGARAAALGRDREKIFAFLRDQVTLEPYEGVLRGARGTLAAEAGNALDRSLLGQALLKASGVESRVVSGRLPGAQAEQLLSRYLATQPVSGRSARCGT